MSDIQSAVVDQVQSLVESRGVEAVSVRVVAPAGVELTAELASAVAPELARRLYPDRFFGGVLYIESGEIAGSYDVDVQVVGRPRSAVRLNAGAGSSF